MEFTAQITTAVRLIDRSWDRFTFYSPKLKKSNFCTLWLRAQSDVTLGVFSSMRSGSVLVFLLQSRQPSPICLLVLIEKPMVVEMTCFYV